MQNVISGVHPSDIGTIREKIIIPEDFGSIKGWKIATSYDLGFYQVDQDVQKNMSEVLDIFKDLGCRVEEIDLGWTEDVFEAWKTINSVRGSARKLTLDGPRMFLKPGKQLTLYAAARSRR
jgi:Asp-tRNA(Asn)/Glu-tRNA(Gln) amidotransferase A subunit family amidase